MPKPEKFVIDKNKLEGKPQHWIDGAGPYLRLNDLLSCLVPLEEEWEKNFIIRAQASALRNCPCGHKPTPEEQPICVRCGRTKDNPVLGCKSEFHVHEGCEDCKPTEQECEHNNRNRRPEKDGSISIVCEDCGKEYTKADYEKRNKPAPIPIDELESRKGAVSAPSNECDITMIVCKPAPAETCNCDCHD